MNDKMNDKEFLKWLYERLMFVHGEPPCADYMQKLETLIAEYPLIPEIDVRTTKKVLRLSEHLQHGDAWLDVSVTSDSITVQVAGIGISKQDYDRIVAACQAVARASRIVLAPNSIAP